MVAAMAYQGGRKFLVASYMGNGFVVPEDEVLGTTRKGKQVLNLKAPDKAAALTTVEGELAAAIGKNRKLVIFNLNQVPEMTRGRGVRCSAIGKRGSPTSPPLRRPRAWAGSTQPAAASLCR